VLDDLSLLPSRSILELVARHLKGDGEKDKGGVIVLDKL
jgi:hypothetical protein